MNYLKIYCDTFDLKFNGKKIFNKKEELVGEVEDDKYVKFLCQDNLIKISDLFLLAFEQINIHNPKNRIRH